MAVGLTAAGIGKILGQVESPCCVSSGERKSSQLFRNPFLPRLIVMFADGAPGLPLRPLSLPNLNLASWIRPEPRFPQLAAKAVVSAISGS
jgi:hypothetical protein